MPPNGFPSHWPDPLISMSTKVEAGTAGQEAELRQAAKEARESPNPAATTSLPLVV